MIKSLLPSFLDTQPPTNKNEGAAGEVHAKPAVDASAPQQRLLPISYFKNPGGCLLFRRRYNVADFKVIFAQIRSAQGLSISEKNLLLARFNRITTTIYRRYSTINHAYTLSKLFCITTSIVNPALLTLSADPSTAYFVYLFWLVWCLQLASSLTTAVSSFLKLERRYLMLKSFKIRVEQEVYLYLELVGRYSVINPDCLKETEAQRTFHDTKLDLLMFRLEYLFRRLKQSSLDLDSSNDEDGGGSGKNGNKNSSQSKKASQVESNGNGGTLLGDIHVDSGTPKTDRAAFFKSGGSKLGAVTPASILGGGGTTPGAKRFASAPPPQPTSAADRVASALDDNDTVFDDSGGEA